MTAPVKPEEGLSIREGGSANDDSSDWKKREIRLQSYARWRQAYFIRRRLLSEGIGGLPDLSSWPEILVLLEKDGEGTLASLKKILSSFKKMSGEKDAPDDQFDTDSRTPNAGVPLDDLEGA